MVITPAILAHNEADFHAKLFHPGLRRVAKRFHIDVLDNTLVQRESWADPAVVSTWGNLPEIEIHLMVTHAVRHASAWKARVPSLKNVIVHAEGVHDIARTCEQLKLMDVSVTVALNPLTPVETVETFSGCANELLLMGVPPGASGQPFLGEPVLAKIRRARALFPHFPLAIDGGVSTKSIHALTDAGINRAIVASALWSSHEPESALLELASVV